jgi:GR25 family glycosyltransferase involved in LPS biosynthesis
MHPKIGIFYYINLDHRTDRNDHMIQQFETYDIRNYERVPGIFMPKKGYLGCSLSHIRTLERFIDSEHKMCVIMEDDFQFTQSPDTCKQHINRLFDENIDFDIVMLSSNTKMAQPYNEYLDKCIRAFTASGFIITKEFAKVLLHNMREGVEMLIRQDIQQMFALDVHWMKLQPISKWYIFRPKLGQQLPSYSDIERRNVNYQC